jgi:hypothetical protein
MTAHLAYESDPDDPVEILHALPREYHAQFRAEYSAAVEGARRPEQFRQLQEMLRLWRLRAAAYSSPGYAVRLAAASAMHAADVVSAEQLIARWPAGHQGK